MVCWTRGKMSQVDGGEEGGKVAVNVRDVTFPANNGGDRGTGQRVLASGGMSRGLQRLT